MAAWLVEAKQNVVENIAPVLTRVFTPLTLVMLLAAFVVLATAGNLAAVDRELLILMDAILVLVLCLLLYSVSARDPLAPGRSSTGSWWSSSARRSPSTRSRSPRCSHASPSSA